MAYPHIPLCVTRGSHGASGCTTVVLALPDRYSCPGCADRQFWELPSLARAGAATQGGERQGAGAARGREGCEAARWLAGDSGGRRQGAPFPGRWPSLPRRRGRDLAQQHAGGSRTLGWLGDKVDRGGAGSREVSGSTEEA